MLLRGRMRSVIAVAILLAISITSSGCVRRRMLVRSYPEGALVHVDDQEVGFTPVSVPFTYYGAHNIRVEKDGFEAVEVDERINPPWYQIPPLDFVFENLWWGEMRDERIVEFQLSPQEQAREAEFRARGEQLRNNVRAGVVTPLINPAN